ncbi:hypothetical protein R3P38DRAFT_3296176 [Favolaschia claudopus]|uniref:Xylanolytic transcriptional activator regulatory domain-containing protein n=1 Tax=Favolaschia claudopus TaxID=2862362 RepID=A0AAV9ZA97_9AGAR
MKLAYRDAAFKSSTNSIIVSHPPSATTTPPPNSNPLSDGAEASLYIMRESLRAVITPPPLQKEDSESNIDCLQLRYKPFESFGSEPGEFEPKRRWLGKSSNTSLVKAAVTFKAETFKQELEYQPSNDAHSTRAAPKTAQRTHHWQQRPSPPLASPTTIFDFPPQPLLFDLINLYFTQINIYIPLLHRPTFEREVRSNLHLRNNAFAATLLLVCAIASRYSDDPSIVAEGMGCGWCWFNQTLGIPSSIGNHLFAQTTLYELQYFPLAVMFLEGSSAFQACWTLIGFGFRLAQASEIQFWLPLPKMTSAFTDEHAHNNLPLSKASYTSGHFGSCLDIEPPLEVDDRFWEDPIHPFKQPRGVPSTVTFFNCLLQLNHILSVGLTTVYPAPKARYHLSINSVYQESFLGDLDSSLNDWLNRVPEHLRWDPAGTNQVFFDQSVALHTAYYYTQILIHRPFVPMSRKPAPTASLTFSGDMYKRSAILCQYCGYSTATESTSPAIINLGVVFTSAIILLLNVWSMRRKGEPQDITPELKHVQKCMHLVKLCEDRWQLAGLLWDILAELMSIGHLPPPTQTNCGSSWPDMPTENIDTMDMDPAQATQDLEMMLEMVDALWANAPVGLE